MRAKNYRKGKFSSERGEGEMHFFMLVVLGAGLFSGCVWLLDWVRDIKYQRYHPTQTVSDDAPAPFNPNGGSFTVTY